MSWHAEDNDNNTFRCLRVVDEKAPPGESNLKLCEFVGWPNWNFLNASDPENEFEMFDLDKDEWETENIYETAGAALKTKLHAELERIYRCKGNPDAGGSCN